MTVQYYWGSIPSNSNKNDWFSGVQDMQVLSHCNIQIEKIICSLVWCTCQFLILLQARQLTVIVNYLDTEILTDIVSHFNFQGD
mgnify:CR=1 FL=1